MARIVGTAAGETLTGTPQDDQIFGEGGVDRLDGGGGNDTMVAGSGNRVIFVESPGDDTMVVHEDNATVIIDLAQRDGSDTLVLPRAYSPGRMTIGTVGGQSTFTIEYLRDFRTSAETILFFVDNLVYTGGADANAAGNERPNRMIGNDGANRFVAGAGNDILRGNGGNDTLDGEAGVDTAVFAGSAQRYGWTRNGEVLLVTDSAGVDGTDTLFNVERLQFSDCNVALDLAGNAGTVAKILGAVFGKAELANEVYAGIGLYYVDGGMTYESLMQLAIDARLGVGASHQAVVDLLYTNVVGSPPPAAEEAHFISLLDSNAYTVASLGVMAAEIDLNLVNINLVGLIQQGLEYMPYFGG